MDFHVPVLLTESIDLLAVKKNHFYLDATLGNGGHTLEILRRGGTVYGLDQDSQNLKIASDRITAAGLAPSFFPLHDNFANLEKIMPTIKPLSGILFDLGLSRNQLIAANRGFSFKDELSLDMRLDPQTQTLTAEEIINTYDFNQLYEIFSKYAQERLSKPLIIQIIKNRQKKPIKSAQELSDIILRSTGYNRRSKLHPATKILMALRIVVNNEYSNLKNSLNATLLLPHGCRVAVITFHSGEDRLVKQFIIKNNHQLQSITKKPLSPSPAETKSNPLSRSSLLRGYEII